MTFLLDDTAISDLVRESPLMDARLGAVSPDDQVATCAVVRGEILYGIERLPRGKRKSVLEAKVGRLLGGFECEPITPAMSDHYAKIKRACESKGEIVAENDLWVAAAATSLGAVLVTRDTDSAKIDGLVIEDWTTSAWSAIASTPLPLQACESTRQRGSGPDRQLHAAATAPSSAGRSRCSTARRRIIKRVG